MAVEGSALAGLVKMMDNGGNMMERRIGGAIWYLVAKHYPDATRAKRAWERLESQLTREAGDEGVGVMRMAPNPAATGPNVVRTGAPPGVHPVVCVTLDRATAAKADRLSRDGTPWTLVEAFADALIARRCRVVLENAAGGDSGRMVIRRPQDKGAELRPGGDMIEHRPARG